MGDMRDALKKAGLASEKDARQAKHRDRVRRKELGEEGLAAERQRRDEAYRTERAQRKEADREREKGLQAARDQSAGESRVATLLQEADLMTREAGPKRFYFATREGNIYFLDVSPTLARRLTQGDAAIVDCEGILRSDYTAVSGKAAGELSRLAPERVISWNTGR